MKARALAVCLFGIIAGAPALAQQAPEHSAHHGQDATAQQSALTDGEVRKVDKDAKKITIRHGAITNLDMPPMTMVFQVQDSAMLDQVKAGDKVKFAADKIGGAITVTRVESVN